MVGSEVIFNFFSVCDICVVLNKSPNKVYIRHKKSNIESDPVFYLNNLNVTSAHIHEKDKLARYRNVFKERFVEYIKKKQL